ncbi:hypothetical protein Zm00014a_029800 [Zea mays]|uniref:Uncharacterized protein n=1 Tax=Zea mays TaxID=4577 RepID=A0A3L6EUL6_MAIZE|nr:hypothetical protein Zm00014a_029800 [Zea mays]
MRLCLSTLVFRSIHMY